MFSDPSHPELWGSPVEDGAPPPPPAPPAEAGPLLPVQRRGPHPADVHVRPAGPLDGLRLVLHRPQRDRKQQPRLLGYRSVSAQRFRGQRVARRRDVMGLFGGTSREGMTVTGIFCNFWCKIPIFHIIK